VVGHSPRQLAGRIFSELCGVLKVADRAVDFESIRLPAIQKIMLVALAERSIVVLTEGAT
jgi:hypothetical protein